jgi:hypothetical protein
LTAHADEHDENEHRGKMVFAHYMVTNQDYGGDIDHRRVPGGTADQLRSSEAYASVVHRGGKLYVASVTLRMDAINVTRPTGWRASPGATSWRAPV